MLVKKASKIKSSEITDPKHYFSRRNFLRTSIFAGTTLATGLVYRQSFTPDEPLRITTKKIPNIQRTTSNLSLHDDPLTSYERITTYNNFYEFSTYKGGVASRAANFSISPWVVSVGGLVAKPKLFDIDDLINLAPMEERIYRLRCVEGWSMVIPWVGFPLANLIKKVDPLGSARYVTFETKFDPEQMPNQQSGIWGNVLNWPYIEGLRLDEAMHNLTILAFGLYGETLPPQNGAPIRLIVPWKYGFKSIKSVVRILLTDREPPTTWALAAPREYGFYSNVNPNVPHPRWKQDRERRIGEYFFRDTKLFNGYAEEVGQLYSGMDLKKYF
jgi:methionine sulfoxide reductase catalytic subunit